ncbi:hypothetical protein HDV64DRAFT_45412 [Trichoderma sp. TUCIM 5745]
MYELPQTLLHLTGPTLQGAFCWEQTWRTPNTDRQPVHTTHSNPFGAQKYRYNHAAGNRLSLLSLTFCPAICHFLTPFPVMHHTEDRPVTSCTYTGAESCTPFQAVPRPPRPLYHIPLLSLSPPFHYSARIPIGQTSLFFFLSVAYFLFSLWRR